MITLTCSVKYVPETTGRFLRTSHLFQSTISGFIMEILSQQIILLCSVQPVTWQTLTWCPLAFQPVYYSDQGTGLTAAIAIPEGYNPLSFDKMDSRVNWTCLSTLNTNVLFTCIVFWVCSRAMTHLLGPACVQRTQQERDADPKKCVQSGENDRRGFGFSRHTGTSHGAWCLVDW
jgi:hypothetical protein